MPGNRAVVHFHTNEAVNDAGFQLSYSSIEGSFFLELKPPFICSVLNP
jgi:hypothetical protein